MINSWILKKSQLIFHTQRNMKEIRHVILSQNWNGGAGEAIQVCPPYTTPEWVSSGSHRYGSDIFSKIVFSRQVATYVKWNPLSSGCNIQRCLESQAEYTRGIDHPYIYKYRKFAGPRLWDVRGESTSVIARYLEPNTLTSLFGLQTRSRLFSLTFRSSLDDPLCDPLYKVFSGIPERR